MTTYEVIPEGLRTLRRWTLHRLEIGKEGGKKQAVPYQRNGYHASSTEPGTWTEFSSVVPLPEGFDGISFALYAIDGLVCIDLDGCRNPETWAIEDWAQAIVDEVDSYTEVSPSGTGLHIFVRGTIPKNSHRQGSRVELYANEKIMATTGDWQYGLGTYELNKRDISNLFARAEAGDFAPQKIAAKPKPGDESAEDFRLIAEVQRKEHCQDAVSLEAAFAKTHPERYADRNREKGGRAGQNYIRYTIENFLRLNPPKPSLPGAVPILDEPEIKDEADAVPTFPRLPGALGQLVEAVGPDLPYDHRALAAVTYLGVGISGRVRLASNHWLQPRFYSCMVGPPGTGKSAPDAELRRALFDATPQLLSAVHVELSVDSGPALVEVVAGYPRTILTPDELSGQFEKARRTFGSKSSLFDEFLKLYEGNETANRTRRRKGEGGLTEAHNVHFAMLGSATTDEFQTMWVGVRGQSSGMQSRFVLSYSEHKIPVEQRPNDEEAMAAALFALNETVGFGEEIPAVRVVTLSSGAQNELEDWGHFVLEDALPTETRLIDMAKRFALVLAACSGATEIDLETMRLGVDFAEYQSRLRDGLFPEDSSGPVQAFENRIEAFYGKHPRCSSKVAMNHIQPKRWPGGYDNYNRAFAALLRAGKLVVAGKSRKGEPLYELSQ